jgi:oxalate decarboxylase
MTSKHLIHLHDIPPTEQTEGGKRVKISKANFPMLKGMSLYKLTLYKNGVREPHWHPNADELGYCLKGSALVSFYGNFDQKETFIVNTGETFFIPLTKTLKNLAFPIL